MNHKFGGKHTETKLAALEEYLRVYTTVMKRQKYDLLYFDAFAGTGDIQIANADATLLATVDDYSPFVKGSAQRALAFGSAFQQYVFVDNDPAKIPDLERLRAGHANIAELIDVRCGDANVELQRFCNETDWKKHRAVVFLDPYGNDVAFETIAAIGRTRAIDLWYLFPSGLGFHRQISEKDGTVHWTHEASLDRISGTREWRSEFIESREEVDLFGKRELQTKRATAQSITAWMAKRMQTVLAGGVLDEWLPLGSRGVHMYSLMFAWANPDLKAQLAGKLARAVLRSAQRGRR